MKKAKLGESAFNMVITMTEMFDENVRHTYQKTAETIYGSPNTPGLATFAYGSPGRIELIGGDSDADILLVEEKVTEETRRFRKLFKERLSKFNFSKVDITGWGSYDDLDVYLGKSLVEGNQILESRFLIGDENVRETVEQKKRDYNSIERELKRIIFNRLYFNQYFRQRIRNGVINIKYCPGGSREFLFVYWHDCLDRMFSEEPEDQTYQPRIKVGLERLHKKGKLTKPVLEEVLEAVGFSMVFRSEMLGVNKTTPDRGLTFLDEATLERLEEVGYVGKEQTIEMFEKYRSMISNVVRLVWEETIKKLGRLKGIEWENKFRMALDPNYAKNIRHLIPYGEDPLMRTALIWGASESNQKELFDYLSNFYRNGADWSTIGSIVCSPLCSPEILHHIGIGIAKEKGYGYLLRVIARNKNVKRKTLESIANDPNLEERYTQLAKVALEGGNGTANHQV